MGVHARMDRQGRGVVKARHTGGIRDRACLIDRIDGVASLHTATGLSVDV